MRRRFNDGHYWNRAQSGEFTIAVLYERHPALSAAHEPFCTRSLLLSYRDQGNNEVARVHQYIRPDGQLGATGQPDPKLLFEDGVLYYITKRRDRARASMVPESTVDLSSDPTSTAPTTPSDDVPEEDN